MKLPAVFLLIFSFLNITLFGQMERASQVFGASINASYSDAPYSDDYSSSNSINRSLNFSPSWGYFVRKDLAIGISGSYSGTFYKTYKDYKAPNTANNTSSKNYNYTVYALPFIRYYEMFAEKFGMFGNLAAGMAFSEKMGSTTFQGGSTAYSYSKGIGYQASLSPGVIYFLTKKAALTCSFGNVSWNSTKNFSATGTINNPQSGTNSFSFGFNSSSLLFGLQLFIHQKKADETSTEQKN
jgi:hypothetical protein